MRGLVNSDAIADTQTLEFREGQRLSMPDDDRTSELLRLLEAANDNLDQAEICEIIIHELWLDGIIDPQCTSAMGAANDNGMAAADLPDRKICIENRSILIAGGTVNVALERPFWHSLKKIAGIRRTTLDQLVRDIDSSNEGSLASAIRVFVLNHSRILGGSSV